MSQSLKETIALIKADMQFRCDYEHKILNAKQVLKFMLYNASVSCLIYRFQMFFYHNHMRWLASLCKAINSVFFTVQIDARTEIGPGFFIMHANYICIGPNVKVGKNCMMAHQNTLCPSPFFSAATAHTAQGPTVGDNVVMGGGACVFGDITIGNNVQISMNAAVDTSFPDNAVLFGVPAKNMSKAATAEGQD